MSNTGQATPSAFGLLSLAVTRIA